MHLLCAFVLWLRGILQIASVLDCDLVVLLGAGSITLLDDSLCNGHDCRGTREVTCGDDSCGGSESLESEHEGSQMRK